jgi:uncharacterized membrane protein
MGLVLCNSYSARINTAIMFYSPETCGGDGQDFEMMGWWVIDPGACKLVYANDCDINRFWYIFGQAVDGTVWAGPFGAAVTREPFGGDQFCWGAQSSGHDVRIGYREFDIGDAEDVTVTFNP